MGPWTSTRKAIRTMKMKMRKERRRRGSSKTILDQLVDSTYPARPPPPPPTPLDRPPSLGQLLNHIPLLTNSDNRTHHNLQFDSHPSPRCSTLDLAHRHSSLLRPLTRPLTLTNPIPTRSHKRISQSRHPRQAALDHGNPPPCPTLLSFTYPHLRIRRRHPITTVTVQHRHRIRMIRPRRRVTRIIARLRGRHLEKKLTGRGAVIVLQGRRPHRHLLRCWELRGREGRTPVIMITAGESRTASKGQGAFQQASSLAFALYR